MPRSCAKLTELLKEMTNFHIELQCYMVEIYLNELKDLLLPPGAKPVDLEPKEDKSGRIIIKGATIKEVKTIEQLEEIFNYGLSHRKTRKTKMNAESSRSHLIFAIEVRCTPLDTDARSTIGKLTFVDLAGSEKAAKTGVDEKG